jgi:hypothetical protein
VFRRKLAKSLCPDSCAMATLRGSLDLPGWEQVITRSGFHGLKFHRLLETLPHFAQSSTQIVQSIRDAFWQHAYELGWDALWGG